MITRPRGMMRRSCSGRVVALALATAVTLGLLVSACSSPPQRDTIVGPRLRVSIATGCPASNARDQGVTNTGDDLNQSLLPAGEPGAALTCSYSGLNGATPFALTLHDLLTQARARNLAALAGQVSLSPIDGGFSCPNDGGEVTVVAFSYPNRQEVDLWYHHGGCQWLSNGKITSGMNNVDPFVQALAAYH